MKINQESAHLKLVFLTAEVGPLLLPEIVGLDDVGGVDAVAEVVLEHLQDRLHRRPAGVAPHVDDNSEAQVPDILAEKMRKWDLWKKTTYIPLFSGLTDSNKIDFPFRK